MSVEASGVTRRGFYENRSALRIVTGTSVYLQAFTSDRKGEVSTALLTYRRFVAAATAKGAKVVTGGHRIGERLPGDVGLDEIGRERVVGGLLLPIERAGQQVLRLPRIGLQIEELLRGRQVLHVEAGVGEHHVVAGPVRVVEARGARAAACCRRPLRWA